MPFLSKTEASRTARSDVDDRLDLSAGRPVGERGPPTVFYFTVSEAALLHRRNDVVNQRNGKTNVTEAAGLSLI